MARMIRTASSGRFISSSTAKRHPRSSSARNVETSQYETVELKTRGKTVKVTPAAAKVLRAAEELRVSVSKDWK